jgi:CheY-like chemotaxis protein
MHGVLPVAESATQTKSRFLAAASHDLRQPMHALSLYLSALGGVRLPESALALLSNAKQCAQAMDEMFSELLDISRLDASAVQADIKVFALSTLLDQIRMEFVPQAQAKGLNFKVVDCSAFVFSDPILIERILRNLVSNAMRYTTHGKVLVGCRRSNDGVRLSVYDTGSGIAYEQQQSIFEEFYQVSNPERDRTQGLGLGLAIVQRLALLLSTRLTLTSQLGRGSVFSIDLPGSGAIDAVSSPMIADTTHHGSLMGALIVVIDDESIILGAMQLLLEQWGCAVIVAASGREAIERLSQCSRAPDIIVCDYRLRDGETGSDVIVALRDEFNENIPALLITGDTAPERIKTLLASGFPVLHKPVQEKILKDALAGLMNQVQTVG